MMLKKREKILALVTLTLLMVVVLHQIYSKYRGSHGGLEKQHANATAELQRMKTRLQNAELAEKRMDKWRQRSLPSDSRAAQSLYQNWLLQIAKEAKFSDTKIDAAQRRRNGDVYYAPQFSFQAKSSLDGLTQFLHNFYSADHLHQILNLTVTPEGKDKPLKVQMTIEALSLSDATSKDELCKTKSQRNLGKLDDYKKKIGGRNLFAAYKPPAKTDPPKPPDNSKSQSEALKNAYLTGVTMTGNRPKAWVTEKSSGDRHALYEGDTFDLDDIKCKVVRIGQRNVEIEIDSKCHMVLLGQNLSGDKDLPKGEKPSENGKASQGKKPSENGKHPIEKKPAEMRKRPESVKKR